MAIQTPYPQAAVLTDGSVIQITEVWRRRQLVVETDRGKAEVRGAFAANGFKPTIVELVKDGQLGRGIVKRLKDWQVHVRFQEIQKICKQNHKRVGLETCRAAVKDECCRDDHRGSTFGSRGSSAQGPIAASAAAALADPTPEKVLPSRSRPPTDRCAGRPLRQTPHTI